MRTDVSGKKLSDPEKQILGFEIYCEGGGTIRSKASCTITALFAGPILRQGQALESFGVPPPSDGKQFVIDGNVMAEFCELGAHRIDVQITKQHQYTLGSPGFLQSAFDKEVLPDLVLRDAVFDPCLHRVLIGVSGAFFVCFDDARRRALGIGHEDICPRDLWIVGVREQ